MSARIQAALNGARPRGFHPALPLTPADLARAAQLCEAAGAVALHVHPRDAAGPESLDPAVIGAAIRAVRGASALPVSVSTGGWIAPDAARRAAIAGWAGLGEARPDEASVNLAEADAPAVIEGLLAAGIGVEAGLATEQDAERLIGLGVAPRCRRILVELDDLEPAIALARAEAILARLDAAGIAIERQLHGSDRSVWPCFDRAMEHGLMTRLGLEDGALLPGGAVAPDNAALIASGLLRAAERADRGTAPRR